MLWLDYSQLNPQYSSTSGVLLFLFSREIGWERVNDFPKGMQSPWSQPKFHDSLVNIFIFYFYQKEITLTVSPKILEGTLRYADDTTLMEEAKRK